MELKKDSRVIRELTTKLYPTASLTGTVLSVNATHAIVRWDDGGISQWPLKEVFDIEEVKGRKTYKKYLAIKRARENRGATGQTPSASQAQSTSGVGWPD